MMDAATLPMLAHAVARVLDGWLLALLALFAFFVLERRCSRRTHWSCAMHVLPALAAAAVLAALTPNLFERTDAAGVLEIPSRAAAAATAILVTLVGHYGARALGITLVLAAAGTPWVLAGSASVAAVVTGLLIGAGTGVLAYARGVHAGRPRRGRSVRAVVIVGLRHAATRAKRCDACVAGTAAIL